MTKALALDLKKLQARAFDRAEWAGEAIRRYHAATSNLNVAEVQPLRALYAWMFVPTTLWPFTRTLAPLPDQSAVISLSVSGFTLLPWNYDAAVASPTLSSSSINN